MSRFVVRHFDVRRGSRVQRYRFYFSARLRLAWLRHLGYSASLTDTTNGWRTFT